mmetsp:Transcript_15750/g.38992  ORF Transcript_15750/g.38992 Transcript_15750/m.38992 type:complete len:294 (+) Transcript_15750:289-1170(+)
MDESLATIAGVKATLASPVSATVSGSPASMNMHVLPHWLGAGVDGAGVSGPGVSGPGVSGPGVPGAGVPGIGVALGLSGASPHVKSYSRYLTVPGHGSKPITSTSTSYSQVISPLHSSLSASSWLSMFPHEVFVSDCGPLPQVGTVPRRPKVAVVTVMASVSQVSVAVSPSQICCASDTSTDSTHEYDTSATFLVPGHGSTPEKSSTETGSSHSELPSHAAAMIAGASGSKQLVFVSEAGPKPHVSVVVSVRPKLDELISMTRSSGQRNTRVSPSQAVAESSVSPGSSMHSKV